MHIGFEPYVTNKIRSEEDATRQLRHQRKIVRRHFIVHTDRHIITSHTSAYTDMKVASLMYQFLPLRIWEGPDEGGRRRRRGSGWRGRGRSIWSRRPEVGASVGRRGIRRRASGGGEVTGRELRVELG
jgi:hypothetical protein